MLRNSTMGNTPSTKTEEDHEKDMRAILSHVNDPKQTTAMNKFLDGKMTYAEMRMSCG